MKFSIANYVRRSRSSFYYPMLVLPGEKREAIMTVYAFCRYTDDIVDRAAADPSYNALEFLKHWSDEVRLAMDVRSIYPLLNDVMSVARKFGIPFSLFFELIEGIKMDLQKNRYQTFDELYTYCYKVASTVGLMTLRILEQCGPNAEAYAVRAGIAMQLTNIIRDVSSDLQRNRIYLPVDEMEKFGCLERDLAMRPPSTELLNLLRFQCRRAHEFYAAANERYLTERSRAFFPARAMQNIYYQLLLKVENNLNDLLERKISLPMPQRANVLIRTWLEERRHG
jgi:phytoene synthase